MADRSALGLGVVKKGRYGELERILLDRKRELLEGINGKRRQIREAGTSGERQDMMEEGERAEANIQQDLEVLLIRLKERMVSAVDEALERLEEGTYGMCPECGDEISKRRLRALPFAVRCTYCQERYEEKEMRPEERERLRRRQITFDIAS